MQDRSWLTRELYESAYKRAVRYASVLGHPLAEAKDFAKAAITRALDPTQKPWSPGMKPDFASHVCNLVRSAHGNHSQLASTLTTGSAHDEQGDFTNEGEGIEAYGAQVGPDEEGPEAALDAKRREDLARVRLDALMKRVASDALIVLLLGGHEGDGTDRSKTSTERALASGHSLGDVELARARLKRHVQAVVRAFPSDVDDDEDDDSRPVGR